MIRFRSYLPARALTASALIALGFGVASAEPTATSAPIPEVTAGQRTSIDTPPEAFTTPGPQVSPFLYLNRCTGGCVIHKGGLNDARTDTSTIPMGTATDFPVSEYENAAGQSGTAADAEWAQVVQCMKEVYSPFLVTVTDVKPAAGISYTMALIAGNSSQILGSAGANILGIAPLASDCSAQDNVISFSFANDHGQQQRVFNICWTAAQESAHAFGLDHEYQFLDQSSACNDPMTYRTDCGGEKFFRNETAQCGEFTPRMCKCTETQNSHLKILSVFGAGTSIVPKPTVSVLLPAPGSPVTTPLGGAVQSKAFSQRGVAHVDLYINGFKWNSTPGAAFGGTGQPESIYTLNVPTNLPNSIVDVQVKAYDDLETESDSDIITVTKGSPCTDASTCATGQKCTAGKCAWDPPSGMLGDACTFPQFCVSGECEGASAGAQQCTQDCIPGVGDSCPANFECVPDSANADKGFCLAGGGGGGGCCSVAHEGSSSVWLHAGLAAMVLGFMLRRRRS